MPKKLGLLLIPLLVALPLSNASAHSSMDLAPARAEEKKALGYYYEIRFPSDALKSKGTNHLEKFKRTVRRQVDVDPIYLIERQMEFFYRAKFKLPVYEQILKENIGVIRDLNLLENYLFEYHFALYDPESEFCALTLKKNRKHIALVESQVRRGIVDCDKVIERAKVLIGKGWSFESHIHNHPFLMTNSTGDIAGGVFPSDIDVKSHLRWKKELGLKRAIVSNGFNSFEYEIGDIKLRDK